LASDESDQPLPWPLASLALSLFRLAMTEWAKKLEVLEQGFHYAESFARFEQKTNCVPAHLS
jgi:hypothetical protein